MPYFMKHNGEGIFSKLKTLFDMQMRKIQFSFRSKRYISTLTTLMRALQLSMNDLLTNNPGVKSVVSDNESIKLFLNFYKLLFLGSHFAEKMLHIKFEEKKKGLVAASDIEEIEQDSSGASFIIDTSDMSSGQSDGGNPFAKGGAADENSDHY